nr:uncharacterized protein LOC117687156 [Crassostrea gigas]
MKGYTQSQKQPRGSQIPAETGKLSTIFREKCKPKHMLGITSEASPKTSTHSLFFTMRHFPRFHYIYNLIRDCKSRTEKCTNGEVKLDKMFKNVFIEIVIVGSFTDDDLHLLTKSAEKKRMPKGKHIWKVKPLVCFANDFFSESNIKKSDLDRENTCHKILIKSDTFCDKIDKTDDSIIIVERNKEQIKETITSCLEEPLHLLLQGLLKVLETKGSSKLASGLYAEIEAIQKQLESCTIKDSDVSHVLRSADASSIVPDNIIDFLFRNPGVHSFGIWWNSSFKVFVNETDVKRLRDDLTKMNPSFFTKYKMEIETGKLKDKLLHLMQGDEIQAKIPNEQKFHAGTLGGIVTKADDEKKKYALTCHHLFPEVGERAYTEKFEDIGACLYTTREKSCDFAAIEIDKSFSEKCNETFQNEDRKITNARLFSESVTNVGIVHKIGAATDVTKGRIISSEYYDKLFDDKNRGHVFLVKGIQGNFSEEGDSGSLVFTRSKDAQQTCVYVLGMVYGNKVTVYDDDDDNDDDAGEQKYKNEDDNESLNASPSSESDNAASNVKEGENISSCYRIHTALELFKENHGEEVKFKDDLSLSSPSTSPEMSSESDN